MKKNAKKIGNTKEKAVMFTKEYIKRFGLTSFKGFKSKVQNNKPIMEKFPDDIQAYDDPEWYWS